MQIYEWVKTLINVAKEKISVFYRGCLGGWLISGTFLFGSSIHSKTALVVIYLTKLFAVLVAGLVSGFATVLGNDIYHWAKARFVKSKVKRQQKRRTKKAA